MSPKKTSKKCFGPSRRPPFREFLNSGGLWVGVVPKIDSLNRCNSVVIKKLLLNTEKLWRRYHHPKTETWRQEVFDTKSQRRTERSKVQSPNGTLKLRNDIDFFPQLKVKQVEKGTTLLLPLLKVRKKLQPSLLP